MEKLAIRLGSTPQDPVHWLVWSDTEKEIIASGELPDMASLGQLRERAPDAMVVGIVPSCDVVLKTVQLPLRANRKVLNAIPFMLEDEMASDISKSFFAFGKRIGDVQQVAVVYREKLAFWQTALKQANLHCELLVPDVLALPYTADTTSLLSMGNQAQSALIVRTAEWAGFQGEQSWTYPLLEKQLAAKPQSIMAYSDIQHRALESVVESVVENALESAAESTLENAVESAAESTLENAAESAAESTLENAAETPIKSAVNNSADNDSANNHDTVADDITAGQSEADPSKQLSLSQNYDKLPMQLLLDGALDAQFNLLQGDFVVKRKTNAQWDKWRVAAVLAAVALCVNLVSKTVELNSLKEQRQVIETQLQASIDKGFPNLPKARNKEAAIRKEMARLEQGGGGISMLVMLTQMTPSFASTGVTPQSIRYDATRTELRMQSVASNFESLEKFRREVQALGFEVDQGAINNKGDQVIGTIIVKG